MKRDRRNPRLPASRLRPDVGIGIGTLARARRPTRRRELACAGAPAAPDRNDAREVEELADIAMMVGLAIARG
jgi:hypothetical protein